MRQIANGMYVECLPESTLETLTYTSTNYSRNTIKLVALRRSKISPVANWWFSQDLVNSKAGMPANKSMHTHIHIKQRCQ